MTLIPTLAAAFLWPCARLHLVCTGALNSISAEESRRYFYSVSIYHGHACVSSSKGVNPMQERAYNMLASRAFVHQYEQYGLQQADFEHCFAQVRALAIIV